MGNEQTDITARVGQTLDLREYIGGGGRGNKLWITYVFMPDEMKANRSKNPPWITPKYFPVVSNS